MILQCKHCGSRYRKPNGQGEFCCAGCEQVYKLIREGGFGDYYEQQDRAGQPVGERPFAPLDIDWLHRAQTTAESGVAASLTLNVCGMSCMGCAWLVEQLARRHAGVRSARVALASGRLSLCWEPGELDLAYLAEELQRFGYHITEGSGGGGLSFSPLAMRLSITAVFSLNGILLLLASRAGIGGESWERLFDLLMAACLLFSQLVGGAVFIKPVWRGLLLKRVHRDFPAAATLVILFLLALTSLFMAESWQLYILLFFLVLPALVLCRWRTELRSLRRKL